jgi:hypothetical protein
MRTTTQKTTKKPTKKVTKKPTKTSAKRTIKKKEHVREGVILKQRYDGICGGIMKTVECNINLGIFDSMEAFYRFWEKNFKEPFSHSPFDPECRRDGLYLERLPLATQETNMKEMFEHLRPVRGWRSEFGRF